MALGGAVGSITGSLFGTLGGMIAGIEEKKLAARERRRTRRGIDQGTARAEAETYDILHSPEYQAVRNFALGTFGMSPGSRTEFGGEQYDERPSGFALQGRARKEATFLGKQLGHSLLKGTSDIKYAGQKITREEGIAKFQAMNKMQQKQLLGQLGTYGFGKKDLGIPEMAPPSTMGATADNTFGPGFGLDSPLARDFRTAIQQAQTVRGIYQGGAPVAAEASGLAAFNFQQQKELLPFLLGLSQAPSQIFNASRSANVGAAVARATGGSSYYGAPSQAAQPVAIIGRAVESGFGGAAAGYALGSGFDRGGGGGGAQLGNTQTLASYGQGGYQSPYGGAYGFNANNSPYRF